jgi:hypothetical protein
MIMPAGYCLVAERVTTLLRVMAVLREMSTRLRQVGFLLMEGSRE